MVPIANNGSVIIYSRIIKPFIKKHEKELDAAFDSAGTIVKGAAGTGRCADYSISMVMHGYLEMYMTSSSSSITSCGYLY